MISSRFFSLLGGFFTIFKSDKMFGKNIVSIETIPGGNCQPVSDKRYYRTPHTYISVNTGSDTELSIKYMGHVNSLGCTSIGSGFLAAAILTQGMLS